MAKVENNEVKDVITEAAFQAQVVIKLNLSILSVKQEQEIPVKICTEMVEYFFIQAPLFPRIFIC